MFRGLVSWAVNLRIATKVAVCFGILIVIGLSGGAATLPSLWRIESSDQRTVQSFEVLDATKTVWIDVLKQESDVRGFLLSRDPSFLDRFRDGDSDIKAALATLTRLTAGHPLQQRRIERLGVLIETWRGQVFAGDKPAEAAGAIGAEGVLGRILHTLEEVKAEDRRNLAARNEARTSALATAYWTNVLAPLIAVLAAAILGFVLHRLFARPITQITDAIRRLADGDVSVTIPCTEWREEIGAISRALTIFQTTVVEAARLREEQQAISKRSEDERADLMRTMAKRFEDVVGSVVSDVTNLATQMQGSAESLLGHAESTTAGVRTVAGVTKQASTTMQEVVLGTQRLSDAVGDINGRMARSTSIAQQAVAEADRTTASIRSLEQSAQEVETVISLISGIARQTNLLALNATIEAARAGEAGRGFSVVASEVKGLADETGRATVQIRQRIESIRFAATDAGDAISRISQTIADMAQATHGMSGVLESQGAATTEMMHGTQASAHLTADVSSQLESVSEGAAMTRRAATGLLASAQGLARQSSVLSEEARRFVGSVRAG